MSVSPAVLRFEQGRVSDLEQEVSRLKTLSSRMDQLLLSLGVPVDAEGKTTATAQQLLEARKLLAEIFSKDPTGAETETRTDL